MKPLSRFLSYLALVVVVLAGCVHRPVPLRYPLTDAQVQTVRDELRVVAMPIDPYRLVPEGAPPLQETVLDCVDPKTHEAYAVLVEECKLNDHWALEIDREHRRSSFRVSAARVIPMSEAQDEVLHSGSATGGKP
jgi:hypothetical protein